MSTEAYLRIHQMRPTEGPVDLLQLLTRCRIRALGANADLVPRDGYITAGEALTPPPQLVLPMLRQLASSLDVLSEQTEGPLDDLYLALFAFYGVIEIHPYADGNGRTALALAEEILRTRWGQPAFAFPEDDHLHDVLGHLLTRRVPRSEDHSAKGVLKHAAEVAKSLDVSSVAELKSCSALEQAVAYLARLSSPDR